MQRITTSTAVTDKFGVGKPGFTDGNEAGGIAATALNAAWFDQVQEEISNAIEGSGLVLDGANNAQLLAAMTALVAQAVGGVRGIERGLVGVWASTTTATWTADQIILQNAAGKSVLIAAYNKTINTAMVGAGGLDTGALAASTWYHAWAIYNPTTPASSIVFSTSATAPTLPAGYTYYARIGTFKTDSGSHIIGFKQERKKTQFVPGSNLATLPLLASGSTSGWSAVSVLGTIIPATARSITVTLINNSNIEWSAAAPNNSYTTTPMRAPLYIDSAAGGSGGSANGAVMGEFILESGSIYYAATNDGGSASTSLLLSAVSYTDSI